LRTLEQERKRKRGRWRDRQRERIVSTGEKRIRDRIRDREREREGERLGERCGRSEDPTNHVGPNSFRCGTKYIFNSFFCFGSIISVLWNMRKFPQKSRKIAGC